MYQVTDNIEILSTVYVQLIVFIIILLRMAY